MIKTMSKSFLPVLKWTSIAAACAVVVISVQVSAFDKNSDLKNFNTDQVETSPAENIAVSPALFTSNDDVKAVNASEVKALKRPWTPANGFADLIEGVSPAVVHVSTAGYIQQRFSGRGNGLQNFEGLTPRQREMLRRFGIPIPRDYGPQEDRYQDEQDDADKKTRPLGIGSGFIISADGYVVTNHHVIDKADKITVTLADGTEYEASIKGSDPKTDLALLKLKDASKLPYVPWGNDRESRVGDWVLAIGNPFGLGGSASTGIISAIGRDINAGPYDDFIQVDAAINRGNSGGPLFNMRGEVIGINSMIFSPSGGSVGIGFSIPASMAKDVIKQLQNDGSVQRGWIGVSIGEVTEELAEVFERDNKEGALISQVLADSPAQKAGIKAGDIILRFNDEKIKQVRDLPKAVAQAPIGVEHTLKIWRKGKKVTMKIVTEAFPSDDVASNNNQAEKKPSAVETNADLGADFSMLTDNIREEYQIEESVKGVFVQSLESRSILRMNGVLPGDVIVQFGDAEQVKSPEDIDSAYKKAIDDEVSSIKVLVSRRGVNRFFVMKIK